MYFFVNAMVTVSAVVFLYTPQNKPASIAILNMDDNGDYAAAAAMSIVIFLINVGFRTAYEFINAGLSRRLGKWKGGDGAQA
jgi:iron(III) transport system permease protein